MPHEHVELLERIRAGLPAGPVVLATVEPHADDIGAVWARETGWKRGAHATPPATVLAAMCARWCAARGWGVEPTPKQLGRSLSGAGWRKLQRDGWRGYAVCRETADTLWAAARLSGCELRRPERAPRRYVPAPRVRPLMAGAKGRPVVDSTLRVYPSAAVAAALVRCAAPSISHACHRGVSAGGRLWRMLTPVEVASLPAGTRAGDSVTSLRW